jgi:hypothetical protein
MTLKTKAKMAGGSTIENDAAAAAGAATDAPANAAGLDDPAADASDDEEGDTPEESVDGSDGVDHASFADADAYSADAADGDDGEEEGASSGENGEATGNDANDVAGDEQEHPAAADEEEEETEELWDLKVVLTAKQILMPRPIVCQGDNCDLVACCIWSSNLDPETPWYSCLDCQEAFFGGWPANPGELPVKVLDDEWRDAIIEKCTLEDEPAMPNLPSSRARNAKDVERATSVEGGKCLDDANADAAVRNGDGSDKKHESQSDNDDDDDDDEQGGGILWELTKIYNAKELKRAKPTMCSAEDCDLVACGRWESNEGEKWFSCLDCQER